MVFMIAAVALPYLMKREQLGSFEYVRKGGKLLEKGRIKESIAYFEKAYASSPENKDIKLNLIHAYSEYGASLAELKDYAKAVSYMAKAAIVEASTSTIQNLAIMYSESATAKADKGDMAGAREDFGRALETASLSESAARNLSISLYNDGIARFREDKDNLAIIFLRESSLVLPSETTFESLGDVYYKKTEFERARFYYGKALALAPQNKDIRVKLQKSGKELVLSAREESRDLPHFELRYDKGLPINAESISNVLEKCYFDVGNDLKYFPDSKTVVFLYSRADFKNIFKMPSVVRAFYDGNIRIPLPGIILSGEQLSDYIYHEYTHAVVSAKTNNNCPIWLSEGIAVWEEYKGREGAIESLFPGSVYEAQLSIGSLDKAFKLSAGNEEALKAHYLLAYSIVKYIVDNWGIEGLRHLLGRIKDGRHIINAIDDEFLLPEKEFEKRWRHYVLTKYLKQAKPSAILE